MTETIRQKIAEQLKSNFLHGEEDDYYNEALTIIKLFEKLIDEKIGQVPTNFHYTIHKFKELKMDLKRVIKK